MSSRQRNAAQIATLLLVLSISACARPIGDFGRAQPDPLHDGAAAAVGSVRGLATPASSFNLTDQEQEMRDRVWRYLVSPEGYDWFGDSIAEIERIGFGSPRFHPVPPDRYYQWLHGVSFASSRVRYSRLSDDIEADLGTMPAVFRSICAVQEVDRQRGVALNGLPGVEAKLRVGAAGARAENLAVIAWFTAAVEARFQSYGYALNHLLVETPHEGAVTVDAKLSDLEVYVDAARNGDFCAPHGSHSARSPGSDRGSRYERSSTSDSGS